MGSHLWKFVNDSHFRSSTSNRQRLWRAGDHEQKTECYSCQNQKDQKDRSSGNKNDQWIRRGQGSEGGQTLPFVLKLTCRTIDKVVVVIKELSWTLATIVCTASGFRVGRAAGSFTRINQTHHQRCTTWTSLKIKDTEVYVGQQTWHVQEL